MDEAIDKALLAHGAWKKRLAHAIEKGDADVTPEVVGSDDQCEFGKWLYLSVEPEQRSNQLYEKVRQIHADFHKEAGRVLALVFSGRPLDAMEALEPASAFARLSGALAFTLGQWKYRRAKACSAP